MQNNVFDEQSINYDNITDLCYSWLFSRLHFIISKYVLETQTPQRVLDVGCGTGFQSFLYAYAGSFVVGIDISENMIKSAMSKHNPKSSNDKLILFAENFDFVIKYNDLINSAINQNFGYKSYSTPKFLVCDVYKLPFPDGYFSHINSCGSVLSLVEHSHLALKELIRVLRPGGTLFIEVESKWNMDRFWTLFDVLLRNKLGYWTTFNDACKPFLSPRQCISISYPYGEHDNPVNIRIKLFTNKCLKDEFSRLNLKVIKRWTILSITNLIPSPILDTNSPSTFLKRLFKVLSFLEEKVPFPLPGCTAAYFLQKNH
ncbi:MAG TPA: methyltransferase domain-containing protein [Nitrososphaeraceae archaeon]